jgi:hypothetical protein
MRGKKKITASIFSIGLTMTIYKRNLKIVNYEGKPPPVYVGILGDEKSNYE